MCPHPQPNPHPAIPPLFDPTKAKRVKLRTPTKEHLSSPNPQLPLDMPVLTNLYTKSTWNPLGMFDNIAEPEHIRHRPNLTTVQSKSSALKKKKK